MITFSTKENIMNEYTQKKGLYEHLSASVLRITEGLMKKDGIKYASAVYRIKDADSLSEKISRKGEKYKTLSDITDVGGVRIITYYAEIRLRNSLSRNSRWIKKTVLIRERHLSRMFSVIFHCTMCSALMTGEQHCLNMKILEN